MTAPDLHIKNATLNFGEKIIFSELSMKLPAGQCVALLGPSGVGKSSLLRMIAGLSAPNEKPMGTIYTENHLPVRQQIAYMAQTDLLLPWLTVLGNATLGLKLRHHSHNQSLATIKKAEKLLSKVKLAPAMHLYPHQLSGGMRQRVALVRTLVENKPIVLMDEPFSALDAITRHQLQALAADLLKEKTVLFITHDPAEALRLANQIYIMQGQPATLKLAVNLSSKTPRNLTDPEVSQLQSMLFNELTKAAGDV